jgi:hypothetical protein
MSLCGAKKIPDVKEQLVNGEYYVGLSLVTTNDY